MPRPLTKFESGKYYHVWTHAIGKENLFREKENYYFFLKKYEIHISPIAKTFAYCLMPNHFHFMIQIQEESLKEPSQSFSNLLNSYAQAFNKMYNRKGNLFNSNIKRREIKEDAYFSRCITYIHQNPTHHGFIKDFEKWEFSSWNAFMSSKPTKIEKNAVLEWFGGLTGFQKDHQKFFGSEEEILFGK